jgi:hypothetical protein
MQQIEIPAIPRLGLVGSFMMYGFGAALLYLATRFLIPLIRQTTHVEPLIAWFIAAGVGVFLPLIAIAALLLAAEGPRNVGALLDRLWLRWLSRTDNVCLFMGAAVILILSAPLVVALAHTYGRSAFTPDFLAFEPLTKGRYWILAAWLPFFVLNMLGEAFVWHSVMLPRQVQTFGGSAWLISGLGWGLFHVALPWQILLSLGPTVFVIPYIVQRRANVWIGVALHVLVNAGGFLGIALGLLSPT